MLKIKTKDGQEINLSESDIREIIKESIEVVKKILVELVYIFIIQKKK